MHQTSIKKGELVQVLYRHEHPAYGIAVDFKKYTESGTQLVCGIMVKVFFLDKAEWYPLIWCKHMQESI